MENKPVEVILVDNGPMIVRGNFTLVGSNSENIVFSPTELLEGVAICLCGKSLEMPFCDGAHVKK